MAVQRGVHPSADVLKAFGLGKLNDSSSEVVMSHLDQCEDCRKEVASLSGDDFLHRLRKAQGLSSTAMPAKAAGHAARASQPPAGQTPPSNLPPELAANQQYEILRELGRGGMGVVYLAKNKLMDRLEVLKVVNKTLLDHPGSVERFLREIRAAAKLNHANVVAAYSALQMGELLAFAMEYVEGQDLASVVKSQGPLPVPHACFYVQQAAWGLQHAFEKGMVHRDIKPQNLILAREGKKHIVKVLDFGLAKATREKKDDTGLTGEGKMLGTPDYIAPEQTMDAAKADIRADIYSLGCTLYYLLSGHPPFSANSLGAMLLAHQSQEAKPLNLVRPEVPEELAALVRRMMAKSPAKRYQTPLEVVQALSPFVKQGATPKASPELSSGTAEPKPVVKIATPLIPPPAPPVEVPKPQPEPADVWGSLTDKNAESIIPGKSAIVRKPRVAAVRERRPPNKWLIGGGVAVGVLLLALLGIWAGGLMVKTKDGTIVLENLPRDAEVLVDGETVTVIWGDGGKKAEIRVKPGPHRVEVKKGDSKLEVKKDGFSVEGKELTFKDGGKEVFTVSLLPDKPPELQGGQNKNGAGLPTIGQEWIRKVRALPAEQQIEAVKVKLKELNPGFDGTWAKAPEIEGDRIVSLVIESDHVNDLTPLQAMPYLRSLSLQSVPSSRGTLSDISPLKGLPLEYLALRHQAVAELSPLRDLRTLRQLILNGTKVTDLTPLQELPLRFLFIDSAAGSDLSPLSGMKELESLVIIGAPLTDLKPLEGLKLWELGLHATQVEDLSPLKGMPLKSLNIHRTRVKDLSPLKGMKLEAFVYYETLVEDISVLKDMPLRAVGCVFLRKRDEAVLRSIKTLETLNGKPVAQLWKELSKVGKAGAAKVSASHVWENDTVDALNNGIEPSSSGDQSIARFTWWDHHSTKEWVQYDFKNAQKVSAVEVYWFDDTGGCRLPQSWRLLYKDGNDWRPVANSSQYGVAKDRFNRVTFTPVETTALRLEVQLQDRVSGGILEWKVE